MSREYIAALKGLKAEWVRYLKMQIYLHEGEEYLHDLAMEAEELKRKIMETYDNLNIKKISQYTKEDMIAEVNKQQEIPPRQYLDSELIDFDIPPYHPVTEVLDREILKAETSAVDSGGSELEIPSEYQSPPVSIKYAAACIGGDMTPKKLAKNIESGGIRAKKLNRQTYIFDTRKLSKDAAQKLKKPKKLNLS